MSVSDEPRCPEDAVVGLDDAFAIMGAVQAKAYDNNVPLNVTLELTLRCNIRCLHCYNFDRDEPHGCHDDEKPELSLAEILHLLGELRAAGCLFLGLTGGEVLSSPHLFPVLDRARELNLAVQLLTNGTLLRPGVAARLAGYRNLLGLSVSLYGATPRFTTASRRCRARGGARGPGSSACGRSGSRSGSNSSSCARMRTRSTPCAPTPMRRAFRTWSI